MSSGTVALTSTYILLHDTDCGIWTYQASSAPMGWCQWLFRVSNDDDIAPLPMIGHEIHEPLYLLATDDKKIRHSASG